MATKYVYSFEEGNKSMKKLLGGKGANLAEMTSLGVPVPPGFTITTEACDMYYKAGEKLPEEITKEIEDNLKKLEEKMGKQLGAEDDPLLVSVRSGAAQSMPGMMDTVLNLGLTDKSVVGLATKTGNERFAWDAYRRFIQMFGNVVMGIKSHKFEEVLDAKKEAKGYKIDTELTVEDLKTIVEGYKDVFKHEAGEDFPQDPRKQLDYAIDAVFGSWNNERAILYRKLNEIRGLLGTAVTVQSMVFGNMGDTSGTGVCFSRDPATGEKQFYGEYLMNAQGEDVVAGIRTPKTISTLNEQMPDVYKNLVEIKDNLEAHYKDMQDMEFTIQEGALYLLQTRNGKRTAPAAVRIAVEMVGEGLLSKEEAIMRVDANQVDQLLHKRFDEKAEQETDVLTKALPASPGAAVGEVIFDAQKADDETKAGKNVILVRTETSPEDLIGMNAAKGILTSRGGMTSHAAVVARGMGKCCISGAHDVSIYEGEGYFTVGETTVKEGEYISLNGSLGTVYLGKIPTVDPDLSGPFGTLMEWADEFRPMKVRTNADTPKDAQVAKGFGAQGIGLCRTEHMFFEGDRIKAMREMILSSKKEDREKALGKILPYQQGDFKALFEAMDGLPVTIRLLDPPLHEFLPKDEADIKALSESMNVSVEELHRTIDSLHEQNPMLGHRGCRLAITYPEIAVMQTKAIINAAIEIKKSGKDIVPEIMVPLVGNVNELKYVKDIITEQAKLLIEEAGVDLTYTVGTMIEVPRGALTADKVAEEAEFFSFGTNDLTQMTLGFSRDDVGSFVPEYLDKNILEKDPFQSLDQTGVGQLIETAVSKGRKVRENMKLGICGEHGGDPSSIDFCYRAGLDYVSCSPYRVPIARLAAAQASIRNKE